MLNSYTITEWKYTDLFCFVANVTETKALALYYQFANRLQVFIYFSIALNIVVLISSYTSAVPKNSTSDLLSLLGLLFWIIT